MVSMSGLQARPRRAVAAVCRFISVLARAAPLKAALLFLLEIAVGVAPAALVWVTRAIVQAAIGVTEGHGVLELWAWIGVWAAVTALLNTFLPLARIISQKVQQEAEDSLQRLLHRKVARIRLEVFESPEFADVVSRAERATSPAFMTGLITSLSQLARSVSSIVGVVLVVVHWDAWLLVAITVAALPGPLAQLVESRASYQVRRDQMGIERQAAYFEWLLTSERAAAEIRTFDAASWVLARWRSRFWQAWDAVYDSHRKYGGRQAWLTMLSGAGVAVGLGWAGWGVIAGSVSVSEFAAMLTALQALQGGVGTLVSVFGVFGAPVLEVQDMFAFLDMPFEEPLGGVPISREDAGSIAVRNVSFRYSGGESVLEGVSCEIGFGESVAIVGENGAGKSTFVKVLLGLFVPIEGRVCYGGKNATGVDLGILRGYQASVFQDYVRFAWSLRDNIGVGDIRHIGDMGAIRRAAKASGADEIALRLPRGYETELTHMFSNGVELSGGEWQRVAVARSLMRDAAVVVMDEPTAALDPRGEAEVFRRFASMAVGRTAILVTHRLGSARLCRRIVVLKKGMLVEQGTHDELLARDGEYARLWKMQAAWYG